MTDRIQAVTDLIDGVLDGHEGQRVNPAASIDPSLREDVDWAIQDALQVDSPLGPLIGRETVVCLGAWETLTGERLAELPGWWDELTTITEVARHADATRDEVKAALDGWRQGTYATPPPTFTVSDGVPVLVELADANAAAQLEDDDPRWWRLIERLIESAGPIPGGSVLMVGGPRHGEVRELPLGTRLWEVPMLADPPNYSLDDFDPTAPMEYEIATYHHRQWSAVGSLVRIFHCRQTFSALDSTPDRVTAT